MSQRAYDNFRHDEILFGGMPSVFEKIQYLRLFTDLVDGEELIAEICATYSGLKHLILTATGFIMDYTVVDEPLSSEQLAKLVGPFPIFPEDNEKFWDRITFNIEIIPEFKASSEFFSTKMYPWSKEETSLEGEPAVTWKSVHFSS